MSENHKPKRIEWHDRLKKIEEPPSPRRERIEQWIMLLMFLALSAGAIRALTQGQLSSENWQDWVVAAWALIGPLFVIYCGLALVGKGALGKKIITWIALAPVIIAGFGVLIWASYSIGHWFDSIPGWAAVIIVLLVVLVLRK